ncbi:MAG: PilZ domain-containing protein [Candidatus Eremiobacteraeota bacterium]|nr:PilZ domain-containing protein [Candidatus Eremiobacteraeota bacterium]
MDLISAVTAITLGPDFLKSRLSEKRVVPRISCELKGSTIIKGIKINFRITDVSMEGLKTECYEEFPRDYSFLLIVEPPSLLLEHRHEKVLDSLLVKVAWRRKRKGKLGFHMGLVIVDPQENKKKSWVARIFEELGVIDELALQKREDMRIAADFPVICKESTGKTARGVIKNISLGGVFVVSDTMIPEGQIVALALENDRRFRKIFFRGKVVRAGYHELSDKWLLGIQFDGLSQKEFKALGSLILEIQRSISKTF